MKIMINHAETIRWKAMKFLELILVALENSLIPKIKLNLIWNIKPIKNTYNLQGYFVAKIIVTLFWDSKTIKT